MKENLEKIINKIEKIENHYFKRSLFIDRNELMILCENIINNNVNNVIEIGTYKGVASAVFASIISGKVYTINIDDDEIKLSEKLWNDLGIKNIVQKKGSSLDILPKLVKEVEDVNFIYVDGNHDIPYPFKEFEIIKNSNIVNSNCLTYFDDGPLLGVMEAIEKHKLTKLENYDWMKLDEINKKGSGTIRAYKTFGDFKVDFKN